MQYQQQAKIGFDLGWQLAEDIRPNSTLREQIARSRGIEEVLSGNDKPLSVGVGVFAASSLGDNLRLLLGKNHMKAKYGKSTHPMLRGGEIFPPSSPVHQPFNVNEVKSGVIL